MHTNKASMICNKLISFSNFIPVELQPIKVSIHVKFFTLPTSGQALVKVGEAKQDDLLKTYCRSSPSCRVSSLYLHGNPFCLISLHGNPFRLISLHGNPFCLISLYRNPFCLSSFWSHTANHILRIRTSRDFRFRDFRGAPFPGGKRHSEVKDLPGSNTSVSRFSALRIGHLRLPNGALAPLPMLRATAAAAAPAAEHTGWRRTPAVAAETEFWRRAFCSYASRVRLKGYGGPFQSSEAIMMVGDFDSTLFNSTPLAYYL